MPSDLESSLVDGGISPAAAKTIANAIANAATSQLAYGRRYGDATPREQLRLVDRNARRYVLTNLDYQGPTGGKHPYEASQPATAQATLSTPSVKGERYVTVKTESVDSVQQSQLDLNVQDLGGSHARMNPSSGAIETVPFSVEIEPKGLLEAAVVEESGRTKITITLVPDLVKFLQFFKSRQVTRVNKAQTDTGQAVILFRADGNPIPGGNAGIYVFE